VSRNAVIILIGTSLATLTCSKGTEVAPTADPGDLGGMSYIAVNLDGKLKKIEFSDTVLSSGDSAIVYRETGIDCDWDLYIVFARNPWQMVYILYDTADTSSGEIFWDGAHVTGESTIETDQHHDIDRDVDDFSVQAWGIPAAFIGLPFDEEDWFVDFDLITPELAVYGFRTDYVGTEGIGTSSKWFNCHKLVVDGRGLYSFAPDIHIFYRVDEPHIPIQCWVEDRGVVFEYFADSL